MYHGAMKMYNACKTLNEIASLKHCDRYIYLT